MDDLLSPAHCVSNNLHQTARAVTRIYSEEMRPSGLKRSQFAILGYLGKTGTRNISDLANILYMERTTLTRNLKPLEKAGYITISISASDARSREISLTREGKSKFLEARKLWRKAQNRVLETFGTQQWIALESSLLELRHKIRKSSGT